MYLNCAQLFMINQGYTFFVILENKLNNCFYLKFFFISQKLK